MIEDVKHRKIVIGLIIAVIASLSLSRLRLFIAPAWFNRDLRIYLSSLTDARELWRARESASIGTFARLENKLPNNIFTNIFPNLVNYEYDQVIQYSSNVMDSLDLVLTKEEAMKMASVVLSEPMELNQSISFTRDNKNWVMGLFDSENAKMANGYFDGNNPNQMNLAWIQLSWVKVMPK